MIDPSEAAGITYSTLDSLSVGKVPAMDTSKANLMELDRLLSPWSWLSKLSWSRRKYFNLISNEDMKAAQSQLVLITCQEKKRWQKWCYWH